MFGQNHPLACALAALLASLVIASQVDAGCFKNLFSCSDKSYEQIASDLYKLVPSSDLQDNIDAAGTLYLRSGMKKYSGSRRDLLFALGAQEATDNKERLCGSSLKGLRVLAEAMAANGNQEPKIITEPVRRLNQIIVRQVVRARAVCFGYLARQWPKPWSIPTEWPNVYKDLQELDSLPHSLLLDSELSPKAKEIEEKRHLRMSCILVRGSKEKRLLMPYADLLMASHIVDPESNKMARYYEVAWETPLLEPIWHPNKELLDNAFRFRACELLAARDPKN